jgi:hypothetical protein
MTTSALIAAVSIPLIGALHRFASSYGYRGLSRREAMHEAAGVGALLAIVMLIVVVAARYDAG